MPLTLALLLATSVVRGANTTPRVSTGDTFDASSPAYVVAISADGARVAAAGGRTVRVFDARSGHLLRELPALQREVIALALSPDGTRLLCGTGLGGSGPFEVEFWDLSAGTRLFHNGLHAWDITAVALSPDGTRALSASRDGTQLVYDARTGALLLEHEDDWQGYAAAFSPEGTRVASGARSGRVTLWDSATGKRERVFVGDALARTLAFDGGGRLWAGIDDGHILVWNVASGSLERAIHPVLTRPCTRRSFAGAPRTHDCDQPGLSDGAPDAKARTVRMSAPPAFSPGVARIALYDGALWVFDAATLAPLDPAPEGVPADELYLGSVALAAAPFAAVLPLDGRLRLRDLDEHADVHVSTRPRRAAQGFEGGVPY